MDGRNPFRTTLKPWLRPLSVGIYREFLGCRISSTVDTSKARLALTHDLPENKGVRASDWNILIKTHLGLCKIWHGSGLSKVCWKCSVSGRGHVNLEPVPCSPPNNVLNMFVVPQNEPPLKVMLHLLWMLATKMGFPTGIYEVQKLCGKTKVAKVIGYSLHNGIPNVSVCVSGNPPIAGSAPSNWLTLHVTAVFVPILQ